MTVTLSEDQQLAQDQILDWLRKDERQCFTLAGLAGTGKTTILKNILEVVKAEDLHAPAVCSFTGKAVSVLRNKGVANDASTIHSLIYKPIKDNQGNIIDWELRDDIEESLIVVDEASMVNTEIYNDLLSFELPILWVGDHGQLEPIGENPNLMATPDCCLEKIHRQAEKNPIIRFAHHLREGGKAWNFKCDEPQHLKLGRKSAMSYDSKVELLSNTDLMICGFNRTRVGLNRSSRQLKNFTDDDPVPGDRVICLKNNRHVGVFNGQIFTVDRITETKATLIILDLTDELGKKFPNIKIVRVGFNRDKTPENERMLAKDHCVFDFAYCITCHKAQGSQANRVLVLEEIWTEKWDRKRWAYTAATRAVESLTYLY